MTGINYDALYAIADSNSVANTVADVCFDMDGLEEQIKEKFAYAS